MDRFRTMESFVRVIRAGSFTIAANQLGLSRALVSRHIGELETRLGVRLLNRTTRSLSVTDEGRAYLDFCEQMFRQIEVSEHALGHARADPAGPLKVAVPKSFGTVHMADAVVDFAKVQPRLRVTLVLEDVSFRRGYDFVERGIDLAVRISSLQSAAVIEHEIGSIEWIVCASPDYLAQAGRPARPADLADHACLVHVNVAANDHIWRFQGPKGAVAVKVSSVFASNSALALRKAALAGLGITLVPRYSVADDLSAGLLVALLPRHKIAPRPLFAVHPRAASAPQKVQVLVDFLRDWVAARDVN
jgi:DNA-binding transcriptional LysR family regulator